MKTVTYFEVVDHIEVLEDTAIQKISYNKFRLFKDSYNGYTRIEIYRPTIKCANSDGYIVASEKIHAVIIHNMIHKGFVFVYTKEVTQ